MKWRSGERDPVATIFQIPRLIFCKSYFKNKDFHFIATLNSQSQSAFVTRQTLRMEQIRILIKEKKKEKKERKGAEFKGNPHRLSSSNGVFPDPNTLPQLPLPSLPIYVYIFVIVIVFFKKIWLKRSGIWIFNRGGSDWILAELVLDCGFPFLSLFNCFLPVPHPQFHLLSFFFYFL